jgi:hypothetical protein
VTVSIIDLDIRYCVCISYNVIQYLAVLVSQFQAIIWIILSLLGILVYNEDIQPDTSTDPTTFINVLLRTYFISPGKYKA